ncbi:MAG: hypothetical protein ACI97N_002554, partial [Cognaticolwellia sp.]
YGIVRCSNDYFQLPEIRKTHKQMQRMMKGTGVKVRKIK